MNESAVLLYTVKKNNCLNTFCSQYVQLIFFFFCIELNQYIARKVPNSPLGHHGGFYPRILQII